MYAVMGWRWYFRRSGAGQIVGGGVVFCASIGQVGGFTVEIVCRPHLFSFPSDRQRDPFFRRCTCHEINAQMTEKVSEAGAFMILVSTSEVASTTMTGR
ncbi:hypothetical protein C8R45DRAFT_1041937 [Mycena sanguinolenta]|nr:hypothetical protein C8R45DRAFT_1041937 [Mycena sanguinolenta]